MFFVRLIFSLFLLSSCVENPTEKQFIKMSNTFPLNIENNGNPIGGSFEKVAVIIEPRKHKALPVVIRNMLINLDDTWKIQVFHGIGNEADLKEKFSKEIQEKRVYLSRMMTNNLTISLYNHLLMSRSFWEQVLGEKILLFELDSGLCEASKHHIEEFLKFDYIGAPWKPELTHGCHIYRSKQDQKLKYVVDAEDIVSKEECKKSKLHEIFQSSGPIIGNSGLSLRSRQKMFQILSEYVPKSSLYWDRSNDLFFACVLADPNNNLRVPTKEDAMKFSTESYLYEGSVGFHKSWAYLSDAQEEVLQSFCPDYRKIKKLYQSEGRKTNDPI